MRRRSSYLLTPPTYGHVSRRALSCNFARLLRCLLYMFPISHAACRARCYPFCTITSTPRLGQSSKHSRIVLCTQLCYSKLSLSHRAKQCRSIEGKAERYSVRQRRVWGGGCCTRGWLCTHFPNPASLNRNTDATYRSRASPCVPAISRFPQKRLSSSQSPHSRSSSKIRRSTLYGQRPVSE